MNIIKLQDQLRGVPDDTLVGYVQNPTGQVPTYLALSELQRRKDMRSKYQANKPEEKTVAEDLVQEAQPQMGVAGLPAGQPMQQAMEAPPEMPMEQMAQGGLADLDIDNMYDESSYATGGIVAFGDGGDVAHYKEGGESSVPWYKHMKLFGTDYSLVPPSAEEIRALQDTVSPNPFLGGMPETNSSYVPYNIGAPKTEAKPAETKPAPPKKEEAKKDAKPGVAPINPYDALLTKNKSVAEYRDEYKSALGDDPASKRLADRLAKMDAAAAKQEERAPWLAIAKAGFEMASSRPEYGKGQSAIADIARGAGAGIKDYAESTEALNKLEEKRFTIENELAKQARAEQVAAVTYGVNSKQHIDEQNKSIQLAKLKDQTTREIAAMENNTKLLAAASKGGWDKKDLFKAYNEVSAGGVSPVYDKWKKEYIDNFGENSVTTADFRNKSDALIKEIINSQSTMASTPTIDTSGVKLISLE